MLRGLALFGVLLVNIGDFSGSVLAQEAGLSYPSGWGGALPAFLVGMLLESKAAALLAMLFGAGLAVQWERTAMQGQAVPFALRRAGALAVLGAAHSFLLWNVDILLDYAVISLLVLPFLRVRASRILWSIPILICVTGLLAALVLRVQDLADQPGLSYSMQLENYGAGSWLQALRFRSWEMVNVIGPMRLANRLPILTPFFILGVYFWKVGFLSQPEKHLATIRRLFYLSFCLGLLANLVPQERLHAAVAGIPLQPIRILIKAVCFMARPGLTIGYATGVLLLLQSARWREWLGRLAPLGRTALSQYLLQSVVCTWIFNGYGLGLFGKVSINACILGAGVLYAVQVWTSSLWLSRHRMGPVEWLWRRMIYGTPRSA